MTIEMKNSALNYALWLLGRRDRSIGEIKEKLASKEHDAVETKAAIEFLLKNNFLDDKRFAKNYIQNQLSIKPLGKYQLKIKLKKKLVPADIIDSVLGEANIDEMELARAATEKWRKKQNYELRIMNYTEQQRYKDKLTRHLVSRGFGWDLIKEAIDTTIDKF